MSTHVFASAVVNADVEKVWSEIRQFTFPAKLFSTVETVVIEPENLAATAVGAERVVTFKGGEVRRHRLLEVSDLKRTISWELLPNGDEVVSAVSAKITTVSLKRVTENNTTFISWETDFSADVAGQNIKDETQDSALNLKEIQQFFSK
eukprot:TRINITY_DN10260_c0_g1_i1.p1 TRINITY_DN10260_c0_g1~~TRINITY_DN10260_c0_g1_i1.p1  ORF type:complete len:149 (-),score=38.02 TRINITY_DN10260_c0_g1_i1:64-510(-)